MPQRMWSADASRRIKERIVIECSLVLQTPARFGNGDTDSAVDMPLLVHPIKQEPLLTGASLVGALRSYLRERESGYGKQPSPGSSTALLFGGVRGDPFGHQSRLVVDDSFAESNTPMELRDGVRIDGRSRTAADEALYNFEAWSAGTEFPLRFELSICEEDADDGAELKRYLLTALQGFDDGGITLGARKHRGYGKVRTRDWRVRRYKLDDLEGLMAWINEGGDRLGDAWKTADLAGALGVSALAIDRRRRFVVEGTFEIDGSVLIRSQTSGKIGSLMDQPDTAHLHETVPGTDEAKGIISGTSLAGALRARARMIAALLGNDQVVDRLFGADDRERNGGRRQPTASRLLVDQSYIEDACDNLVQTRIKIDRFTQGTMDGALFNEQPSFGGRIQLRLQINEPSDDERGLVLLLLKDLWTGDLPIGGESSIGRGRLKGVSATIADIGCNADGEQHRREWTMKRVRVNGTDNLELSEGAADLEAYVKALDGGNRQPVGVTQ